MGRLAAGVIATLVLSIFTFGGAAAAWNAPTLTAVCAPDASHYAWTITLANESNYKIDESWNSSFSGATTTDFGTAGAHSFTTARGGAKLFVRWNSDHTVTASATANGALCGGTAAGGPCSGNATMTTHSAIQGADQGGMATVTFTMSNGCTGEELTLVSYTAPSATFSRDTASQQQVFDMKTGTYTNGTFTLSVAVPSCFFQVDFVTGKVIAHLGPASSNNFYSDQGRLIEGVNGGTTACNTGSTGGTGTSTGTSTGSTTGTSTGSSTGTSTGTSTGSTTGSTTGTSTGSTTGSSTGTSTGTSTGSTTGSSTGTSTGTSTGSTTGSSTGTSTGSTTGSSTGTSTGSSTGTSTGSTTGSSTGTSTGSTTGSSTGTSTGSTTGSSTGSATGTSTGSSSGTSTGSTTGTAVAGFQTPPANGAVGAVTPIVELPGGSNQLPPGNVQGVQTSPVAGVQSLPSTSTDGAPTIPLAVLGFAMMGAGGVLLRRRDTRI